MTTKELYQMSLKDNIEDFDLCVFDDSVERVYDLFLMANCN